MNTKKARLGMRSVHSNGCPRCRKRRGAATCRAAAPAHALPARLPALPSLPDCRSSRRSRACQMPRWRRCWVRRQALPGQPDAANPNGGGQAWAGCCSWAACTRELKLPSPPTCRGRAQAVAQPRLSDGQGGGGKHAAASPASGLLCTRQLGAAKPFGLHHAQLPSHPPPPSPLSLFPSACRRRSGRPPSSRSPPAVRRWTSCWGAASRPRRCGAAVALPGGRG